MTDTGLWLILKWFRNNSNPFAFVCLFLYFWDTPRQCQSQSKCLMCLSLKLTHSAMRCFQCLRYANIRFRFDTDWTAVIEGEETIASRDARLGTLQCLPIHRRLIKVINPYITAMLYWSDLARKNFCLFASWLPSESRFLEPGAVKYELKGHCTRIHKWRKSKFGKW